MFCPSYRRDDDGARKEMGGRCGPTQGEVAIFNMEPQAMSWLACVIWTSYDIQGGSKRIVNADETQCHLSEFLQGKECTRSVIFRMMRMHQDITS